MKWSMNQTKFIIIEVVLVIAYLVSILFFIDISKVSGIVIMGVLAVVIFFIIFFLEKMRKKGKSALKQEEGGQEDKKQLFKSSEDQKEPSVNHAEIKKESKETAKKATPVKPRITNEPRTSPFGRKKSRNKKK